MPSEQAKGAVVVISNTIRDERRLSPPFLETPLADPDRRSRLLVKSISDCAFFALDAEGRVADWNRDAERLMGYDAAEILGRHFSIFCTDDDRDCGLPAQALDTACRAGSFEAEGWR